MKKPLNIKKLLVSAAFLIAPSLAFSSSWYFTSIGNDERIFYFDADSVEKNKEIVSVWIKTVQTNSFDTDGSWATAYRWRINCSRRTIQSMTASTYDKDGKFIKSYPTPGNDGDIVPDSTGEAMQRIACAQDFPKNKSEKDYIKVSDNDIFENARKYAIYLKSRIDSAPK